MATRGGNGRSRAVLVEVRVDGGAQEEAELRLLQDWLRQEPAVRAAAAVSLLERPAQAGAMGGWVEAVQLVTDNGWSAASFVLSVLAWRQTRPRPPRITIRRGGVEVSMTEYSDAEVQRVVAMLEAPGGEQDQP
jgi:hypothetical protein